MTLHREPQEKALSPPRFPRRCDTGQFVPVRRACRQLVENALQVHKGQEWGSEIVRGRASYGGCAWAQETVSPGRVGRRNKVVVDAEWRTERRALGMTRKRQRRSGARARAAGTGQTRAGGRAWLQPDGPAGLAVPVIVCYYCFVLLCSALTTRRS